MKIPWNRMERALAKWAVEPAVMFLTGAGLAMLLSATWGKPPQIAFVAVLLGFVLFYVLIYNEVRRQDQIAAVEKRIEEAKARGDIVLYQRGDRVDTLEEDDD